MGGDKECDEKETVTFEIKTEAEPTPTVKWYTIYYIVELAYIYIIDSPTA